MDSYLVVLRVLPRRFFDSIVTKKLQKNTTLARSYRYSFNNFEIFEVESKSIYIKKKKKKIAKVDGYLVDGIILKKKQINK